MSESLNLMSLVKDPEMVAKVYKRVNISNENTPRKVSKQCKNKTAKKKQPSGWKSRVEHQLQKEGLCGAPKT